MPFIQSKFIGIFSKFKSELSPGLALGIGNTGLYLS